MSERFLRAKMLLGDKSMEKLTQSHVAVFGLGGVGSWCAEALARSGVGEMTLVDEDTVGESNINRQLCALQSSLGKNKSDVMAERVKDINPEIICHPLALRYEACSREQFFQCEYDYIIDCIDLVACKLDLIESAMERSIPIISAMGAGNKFDAGMLEVSDISKTQGCPLARVMRKELRKKGINQLPVVYSSEKARTPESAEQPPPGRRSIPGSLVWVTATAGMLLCSHVVTELISE